MKFACRRVGLDFIASAHTKLVHQVELDAPASEVFDIFADGESWTEWFGGIDRVEWTSPEPKAVGTTRTVTLGRLVVDEVFLAWDPGKRFTFCFTGHNRPLFHALLEDYALTELGPERCRLTYSFCYDPRLPMRLAGPIARMSGNRMCKKACAGLARYVAK